MANVFDTLRSQEKTPKKKSSESKTEKKKTVKKVETPKKAKPTKQSKPQKEDYEKRLEAVQKKREKAKRTPLQAMKQMSKKQKRKLIIFAILISYGCFLIYGVANSDFVINEDGLTMPVAKSQEDVKEMKEYELIKSYYMDAQNKYKEILKTDVDLATNVNSQKVIATRYEGYLSFFDNFITQLRGVEVSETYVYVKEGLLSWATNDIAVYLNNIGKGISMNNQETKANALEDRIRSINDFNIITENMLSISSTIRGANAEGLDFNPETYYEEVAKDGVQ